MKKISENNMFPSIDGMEHVQENLLRIQQRFDEVMNAPHEFPDFFSALWELSLHTGSIQLDVATLERCMDLVDSQLLSEKEKALYTIISNFLPGFKTLQQFLSHIGGDQIEIPTWTVSHMLRNNIRSVLRQHCELLLSVEEKDKVIDTYKDSLHEVSQEFEILQKMNTAFAEDFSALESELERMVQEEQERNTINLSSHIPEEIKQDVLAYIQKKERLFALYENKFQPETGHLSMEEIYTRLATKLHDEMQPEERGAYHILLEIFRLQTDIETLEMRYPQLGNIVSEVEAYIEKAYHIHQHARKNTSSIESLLSGNVFIVLSEFDEDHILYQIRSLLQQHSDLNSSELFQRVQEHIANTPESLKSNGTLEILRALEFLCNKQPLETWTYLEDEKGHETLLTSFEGWKLKGEHSPSPYGNILTAYLRGEDVFINDELEPLLDKDVRALLAHLSYHLIFITPTLQEWTLFSVLFQKLWQRAAHDHAKRKALHLFYFAMYPRFSERVQPALLTSLEQHCQLRTFTKDEHVLHIGQAQDFDNVYDGIDAPTLTYLHEEWELLRLELDSRVSDDDRIAIFWRRAMGLCEVYYSEDMIRELLEKKKYMAFSESQLQVQDVDYVLPKTILKADESFERNWFVFQPVVALLQEKDYASAQEIDAITLIDIPTLMLQAGFQKIDAGNVHEAIQMFVQDQNYEAIGNIIECVGVKHQLLRHQNVSTAVIVANLFAAERITTNEVSRIILDAFYDIPSDEQIDLGYFRSA